MVDDARALNCHQSNSHLDVNGPHYAQYWFLTFHPAELLLSPLSLK